MGKDLTRLPADTPRTPGPRNVDFQQFCDRLRTDLPGDSHGRGSFDTSAHFVAGDPGAKFGAAAPLEYEVTGEIGHPHWELIFEYVLRQCGYLVEFHTIYVMVDNRDLANHTRQDPSLPHWPAAARWWHSRLKLIGPHKEKTELLLFSMEDHCVWISARKDPAAFRHQNSLPILKRRGAFEGCAREACDSLRDKDVHLDQVVL